MFQIVQTSLLSPTLLFGSTSNFFALEQDPSFPESDLLHGSFESDLRLHTRYPWLLPLLTAHKIVFGELPKAGECPKPVVLDLKLKPEWQKVPLRTKCYPMSKPDQEEIARQVQDLVDSGLVELFPADEYPLTCSPVTLVEKEKGKDNKVSKTKIMVGDYRRLTQ
jgi:hypothetical protein